MTRKRTRSKRRSAKYKQRRRTRQRGGENQYVFMNGGDAAKFCQLAEIAPHEIGFLYSQTSSGKAKNMLAINGDEDNVWIPSVPNTISAHVHPTALYGKLKHHPPTGFDLWECLKYKKRTWNIVFEANGVWAYRPNKNLADEYWEQADKREDPDSQYLDLQDVVQDNGGRSGARLALAMIPNMLPSGATPIDLPRYLREMPILVSTDMGFEVLYTPVGQDIILAGNPEDTGDERNLDILVYVMFREKFVKIPISTSSVQDILNTEKPTFDANMLNNNTLLKLAMKRIANKDFSTLEQRNNGAT